MKVEYKPECFSEGVFSGTLVLHKPSVADLFEGSEIAKKGEQAETQLEATKSLLDWSKKFYAEVDIKNIDGSCYKSFDDLMSDSECLAILQEVAVALVVGLNKKKLQAVSPTSGTKTAAKEKSSNK